MVKVFNQAIGTRVISGATDNHLMLIDVRELGINGKEAEHFGQCEYHCK